MVSMSHEIDSAVVSELHHGEQVRWVGIPSPSFILVHNLTKIMFGFLFTFAPMLSTENGYLDTRKYLYQIAIALIFFAIGLKVVIGSLLEILSASKTIYAVTDRRIIIIRNLYVKKVISIKPEMINAMEYNIRKNGRGTVLFRFDEFNGLDASGTQKSGFRGVSNVLGAVEALNLLRG